ncbi:MAG: helix-turn-helix transcriptional regulator, partial [Clostridiales bacterium]|nr:helix-turn-helix transcriptional regulator [Clostridiales bacterium]
MNSNGKEYQNELLKVANEARKVIKGEYNVHIDFAIGGLHTNLEGVPKAYSEAINAMEYSKVMGAEQVVFYDNVIRETVNSYYYPIEQEYQLINCIESADYEAAANIFEEVFQKNYVDSTPSLDIAQCLMFDMISTVLKAVDGLGQLEGRSYFDSTNPITEVMQCRTLLEMKDKMLKILENACEYFEKQNSQTDYSIRDMVIDIIDNNFKDPNLSIASIAEQVNKHPYYVSRLFKKQTGDGILDYINKVRVDKAK